ncbi:MAG: histidine kinase [Bacteroidia bacterium]|nr:histidine kinase [Bacteroidia bacterium]
MRYSGLFFFLILRLNSFGENVHAEQFTINDGLFSNKVYAIEQDDQGFIWAATENGVSKFNAYGIESYTVKDGLNSNDVRELYRDKNGTLWFGCFARFPNYLSKNNTIEAIDSSLMFKGKVIESNHLFFDKWRQELYMVYRTERLDYCYYNLTNHTYFISSQIGSPIELTFVEDGIQYYLIDGALYLNLNKKLVLYKGPIGSKEHFHREHFNQYTQLAPYQTYVTISPESPIVFHTIGKDGTDQTDTIANTIHATKCVSGVARPFFIVNNIIYKYHQGEFQRVYKCPTKVRNLYEDKDRNLWIVTIENGVFLARRGSPINLWYITDQSQFNDLELFNNGVYISSFEKLGIWKAVDMAQLYEITTPSDEFEMKLHSPSYHSVSLTYGNLERLSIDFNGKRTLKKESHGSVKDFKTLNDHESIVGTTQGFFLYDSDKNDRKRIWDKHAKQIVPIDSHLFLLVSVYEVRFYNASKKQLSTAMDRDNLTQITTMSGKILGLTDRRKIKVYDSTFRLLSEHILFDSASGSISINSLKTTKDNGVLLATTKGWYIFQYHPKTRTLEKTHQSNLSTLGKVHNIVDICLLDNQLFYVTEKSFYRTYLTASTNEIHQVFCDALIGNNTRLNWASYSSINRRMNDITVRMNYTSSTHAMNVPLLYKLEGLSDNWFTTNSCELNFPNLKPGTYSLYIKPKNTSQQPFHVVRFTIKPFLYETSWFRFLSIAIVTGLLILGLTIRQRKKTRQLKLSLETEQKMSDMELRSMRAAMNPHFIFNSLNSIQYFYVKNDIKTANYYLSRFSDLVRKILDSSVSEVVSLEDEITLLKNYLELEKMRLKEKLNYQIDCDPRLDELDVVFPQMLIQPFVENAIFHGMLQGELLRISFKLCNDFIVVVIDDNGIGIKESRRQKKGRAVPSISSDLTSKRMSLLKHRYSTEFSLKVVDKSDIDPNDHGTIVTIKLPIHHESNYS